MSKPPRVTLTPQQQSEYQRYLTNLAQAQLRETIQRCLPDRSTIDSTLRRLLDKKSQPR